MNLAQENKRRVEDYSKTATMQDAVIFCAFSESKSGNINLYLSKVQDAKITCQMLRKVADDLELRSKK